MGNYAFNSSFLKLTFLCILFGSLWIRHVQAVSHVCTKTVSYSQQYKTKCGWLNIGRCTRYRTNYRVEQRCCPGYKSSPGKPALECDIAVGSQVCTKTVSYSQSYTTRCGFLNLSKCTRYRTSYRVKQMCCAGFKSAPGRPALECNVPI